MSQARYPSRRRPDYLVELAVLVPAGQLIVLRRAPWAPAAGSPYVVELFGRGTVTRFTAVSFEHAADLAASHAAAGPARCPCYRRSA